MHINMCFVLHATILLTRGKLTLSCMKTVIVPKEKAKIVWYSGLGDTS